MNEIWFGYKVDNPEKPLSSILEFFELLENPPLCMVQCLDQETADFINETWPAIYCSGQWIVSRGDCNDIHLSFPFDDIEKAFNHAREELGTNKFLEQPKFNHL